MLYAASVQLTFPEALAKYKGWPASTPIQILYAFALIELSVAALLCIRFRGVYLLGPAVAGSLLLFGGAYVHIGEILRAGRFVLLRDGPEIVLDLVVPVAVLSLAILHLRRSIAVTSSSVDSLSPTGHTAPSPQSSRVNESPGGWP